MIKRLILCTLLVISVSFITVHAEVPKEIFNAGWKFVPDSTNQEFRNDLITTIEAIESASANANYKVRNLDLKWNNFYQSNDWNINLSLFYKGTSICSQQLTGQSISQLINQMVHACMKTDLGSSLNKDTMNQYRFKVTFNYFPYGAYSFIQYHNQGIELIGNRVAVRKVTLERLKQQIESSKAYLLRVMNPKWHGFYKVYDARQDIPEVKLRTIYSSSSLYTLLKLEAFLNDNTLEPLFKPIADFILSNQSDKDPVKGAFAYSFNPQKEKRSCRYVVGTTSKTIFTLIELNKRYPEDKRYINAAIQAGNWLTTMVNDNGDVTPITYCNKNGWHKKTMQSMLYSGQVLSALSRLYKVTQDKQYHDAAKRIADHFINLIETKGPILGDNYRPANSISSSWAMMSLIDFAKVDDSPIYLKTIELVGNHILNRQITNQSDLYNYGRYLDSMTPSGNGWINEVFGVYYEFCQEKKLSHCERYQQAMILTSRWLLQNAYTAEDTYAVKNPAAAIGGFITRFNKPLVRTDAVCHGVNSLISLLQHLPNTQPVILTLPERPLAEVLPLLRSGGSSAE